MTDSEADTIRFVGEAEDLRDAYTVTKKGKSDVDHRSFYKTGQACPHQST